MATVYLPVEPQLDMTSAERAEAIDREVWRLRRPLSVQSPNDVTQFYYPRITHPTTGEVAVVGDTTEQVKIHPDVDLTDLLALLPEVPQEEKGRARHVHRCQPWRNRSLRAAHPVHLDTTHARGSRGRGVVPGRPIVKAAAFLLTIAVGLALIPFGLAFELVISILTLHWIPNLPKYAKG
jgi:hypothetical protein